MRELEKVPAREGLWSSQAADSLPEGMTRAAGSTGCGEKH